MKITIKLFALLRKGRFDEKYMECAEGTTVDEICRLLGITDKSLILFVNSKHVELNYVLSDGDVLAVFPVIGGG